MNERSNGRKAPRRRLLVVAVLPSVHSCGRTRIRMLLHSEPGDIHPPPVAPHVVLQVSEDSSLRKVLTSFCVLS